jgi:hypothetical protein
VLPFGGSTPGALFRRVLVIALATGASCGLAAAVARLADPRTPLGLPAAADPETERGRQLNEQLRTILCRCSEDQRLAREVAAGRLGLVEAAAGYRDLTADDPTFNQEAFRRAFPGGSDEERYCRQVIAFVRETFRKQPGADPAVVERLEAELQDRLERGDLSLPGPDDVRPEGR